MGSAPRRDTSTVAFVGADWCWRLVDAYEELTPLARAELDARWAARPFRHMVAVASAGAALSEDLEARWQRIFRCPLTWHFSCAEAGALYNVVRASPASLAADEEGGGRRSSRGQGVTVAAVADAIFNEDDWRVEEDGHLTVRGEVVFQRYQGRPRSTCEAFGASASELEEPTGKGASFEGSFCRTGHHVRLTAADGLLPLPPRYDQALRHEAHRYLEVGPGFEPRGMKEEWRVKKVPIRIYHYWKSTKGHFVLTKKHNNARMAYYKYNYNGRNPNLKYG